ncbi:glycerophosphoinositol inositolphosphodiesterase GDPD2 [Brienomyrus brachyistius]|uniref:glycerophosphoinositol inositolphosphodiesterase GDPD2 n=1 Tax=Brienomyrus brachyistius TaxID=42636 RepID=UPI0020B1ED51|nr:glycerophosphoinositol inositolphosphodiesterase GDPD2 [Brienomyrus brachyistius]XP_048884276.1 glycerophosphoinositol inositolphosphodiesterase GDPD2 [Brienomyrus brachyistius]XP_048884277.1 glycerophosphoinositol inositolphosphodiesterase GDPD2 [Brienomyrus brachyistius]XP_048884278.1 glycerophosphoinositol inositolphosphodiesterase GDPD2 [Brienomyrus brachyistius]
MVVPPSKAGLWHIFCRGVYSCDWSRGKTKQHKRSKHAWLCIFTLVSALTLGWLYICMMAYNDRDDVNWKAFICLKKWLNWFMIVVVFSSLLAVYCCLLLLFSLFLVAMREPLNHLHVIHKVLLVFSVLIITAGLLGITFRWPEEWKTVSLSLQATGPFLQLGGVLALTLLSGFVFRSYHKTQSKASKVVIMGTFTLLTAAVFLSPLSIESPCLCERVPGKPKLIGHRGAPMLAPENTMMSFKKSAKYGVFAFETDVMISKDGVPFLMHDDKSLRRTTDVQEQIPDQADNKSSSFTWSQLEGLNAGNWFLKNDPFHTVSSLSETEKADAKNQSIPRLSELLALAKQENISIIFDLKEDTNSSSDTDYVIDTILKSGIPPELVLWLPPLHRKNVMTKAPRFRHIYDNETEMYLQKGNQLNYRYNEMTTQKIRELQQNVSVNLWTVNEPWLFSLMWCAGAHSVTTNACHLLQSMKEPVWYLAPSTYKAIWICADVASLLAMAVVFFLQRRWRSKRRYDSPSPPLILQPEDDGSPTFP